MAAVSTFLYFAYGSNLLAQRIHIKNPSAIKRAIGKLQGYRLDFNHFSKRWKGYCATIVPDTKSYVWGVVWEMDLSDMPHLDRQEGVHKGFYKVIEVDVTTPESETLHCRCYELVNQPSSRSDNDLLPTSRYPSKIYKETIIAGAIENKIPEEYINFLKKFPDNGFAGPIKYKLDLKMN